MRCALALATLFAAAQLALAVHAAPGKQPDPAQPAPAPEAAPAPGAEGGPAPEAASGSATPAGDEGEGVTVTITGSPAPAAASAVKVSGGELKMRPRLRPADIIEATPGLFAVQHAGGGKANQYFLRGFDIDHGTDLALFVDGVPVNMVSHGHGQGYADLHFLIPELVSSLEAYKGPYYADLGDFATAGAVNMKLADHLEESQASFTLGQYGILRGLGIVSREFGEDWRVLLAGEACAQDGPFQNPEELRRFNAVARVTHDLSPAATATITWMSYSGRWSASGQIPSREVEAGRIDRFGTIDPFEGGETQRHSLSARVEARGPDATFELLAYAIRYDFSLFSDFTFFLNDPVHGDMIEQVDDRGVIGLDARTRIGHRIGSIPLTATVGAQARADSIDGALHHDYRRERLSTAVDASVEQTGIGLFAEEEARIARWLSIRAGLRVDRADVIVEDHLDDPATIGDRRGGTAGATLASPKIAVTLSPLPELDLYLDLGRGFHSNDARGAVRAEDPATLLVPATGYEAGARAHFWKPLTLTAALFRIDIESEQVYVGDEGTTEPSDPTTRLGAEFGARLYFGRELFADADVTFTRAAYRANAGNGGAIALAPTRTLTAGVGFRAPFGTFGSVRVRSIGARPATEDERIVAEGWTVVDAQVGHRVGPFELAIDAQNLLDADWKEVQFATESRLQGEPAPVEEIHFAPGWPLTVMARATAYF